MTELETITWIFLATAIASEKEPADLNGISMIADGINHAVPAKKETINSLSWLISKKLIKKEGSKYTLTKEGMIEYNFASLKTTLLLNIWKNLERQFKNRI